MKRSLVMAGLALLSAGAMAADVTPQTTREQRMDDALQNYRSTHNGASPGPAARAEESIKHGARRAGQAIKHGAERAGHAVGRAVGTDNSKDKTDATRKTTP